MDATARAMTILGAVPDPVRGGTLASSGRVSGIRLAPDGAIGLVCDVGDLERGQAMALVAALRAALGQAGFASVRIVETSDRPASPGASPDAPRPAGVQSVRAIVAVGAGKGGVGKSTVAVGLALAWARMGLKVGILDADIQGPSVHLLLGIEERAGATADKRLQPLFAHGVAMLGMGVMADPDKAVAWRGPMIAGAVVQMAQSGLWGALDVLVVDLPPGTGDIHLALAQKLKPAGAIVVTTPGRLALADARRAASFFHTLSVPVLGLIANMAEAAPGAGGPAPFGALPHAAALPAQLLATLPLDPAVTEAVEAGRPPVAGPLVTELSAVAQKLAVHLGLEPSGASDRQTLDPDGWR